MPAGRPRSTTPPKNELMKLGKELVAWATKKVNKQEKLNRVHFAQWYSLTKGLLKKEWDLMLEKPEFQAYYEQARIALGRNYIDGTICPSIAHRFIRHYFPDVKHEENEQVAHEASLKSPDNVQVNPELLAQYEALLKLMANSRLKTSNEANKERSKDRND